MDASAIGVVRQLRLYSTRVDIAVGGDDTAAMRACGAAVEIARRSVAAANEVHTSNLAQRRAQTARDVPMVPRQPRSVIADQCVSLVSDFAVLSTLNKAPVSSVDADLAEAEDSADSSTAPSAANSPLLPSAKASFARRYSATAVEEDPEMAPLRRLQEGMLRVTQGGSLVAFLLGQGLWFACAALDLVEKRAPRKQSTKIVASSCHIMIAVIMERWLELHSEELAAESNRQHSLQRRQKGASARAAPLNFKSTFEHALRFLLEVMGSSRPLWNSLAQQLLTGSDRVARTNALRGADYLLQTLEAVNATASSAQRVQDEAVALVNEGCAAVVAITQSCAEGTSLEYTSLNLIFRAQVLTTELRERGVRSSCGTMPEAAATRQNDAATLKAALGCALDLLWTSPVAARIASCIRVWSSDSPVVGDGGRDPMPPHAIIQLIAMPDVSATADAAYPPSLAAAPRTRNSASGSDAGSMVIVRADPSGAAAGACVPRPPLPPPVALIILSDENPFRRSRHLMTLRPATGSSGAAERDALAFIVIAANAQARLLLQRVGRGTIVRAAARYGTQAAVLPAHANAFDVSWSTETQLHRARLAARREQLVCRLQRAARSFLARLSRSRRAAATSKLLLQEAASIEIQRAARGHLARVQRRNRAATITFIVTFTHELQDQEQLVRKSIVEAEGAVRTSLATAFDHQAFWYAAQRRAAEAFRMAQRCKNKLITAECDARVALEEAWNFGLKELAEFSTA